MSYDILVEESTLSLEKLIDDFGGFRECPTSIKHAKTGKYILCNGNLANRDGIPIEDYIGLTSQDVKEIMHLKESVISYATNIDQRIITKKIPGARYNQVALAYDKSVVVEEVFKRPVLGKNKQIAAILAYGHDITRHAHPLYLFNLYVAHHPIPEAIRYFLRYKNLDTVFEELPTREELLTLITMRDTLDQAVIAKSLHYSIQDVARYQDQLAAKLKVIGIRDVLTHLQWYSEEEAGKDVVC